MVQTSEEISIRGMRHLAIGKDRKVEDMSDTNDD